MKLELKGVKFSEQASQETNCFEATVYVNGKRAFTAHNDGRGGDDYYYPIGDAGAELLASAKAWAKTQTFTFNGKEHECGLELVIAELFAEWYELRWLKRQCRNKTLFRFAEDRNRADDEWRVIKGKFSAHIKAGIKDKWEAEHGPIVFANEIIGQKAS
jgi:hypothetical protein